MGNKKGEKDMGLASAVTETITDKSAILSLKQVHNYTDLLVQRGHAEYNGTGILVRSKHPLDECLRRSIIEQEHYDVGNSFRTIRDCAFGRTQGRIYNDTGEGDSGIDAGTLYVSTCRNLTKKQWETIKLICFAEPDAEGEYFSAADYHYLYGLAPNIQSAFDALDSAFVEARRSIKERIENAARS